MRRTLLVGVSVAVLALSAGAVNAEDQAVGPSVPPSTVAEVVVTAEKRSENIQTVPMSVAAISADTLQTYHATRLTDFSAYVPGLQVTSTSGNPGEINLTIRGISTGQQSSSTVATVIDDIPIGSSSSFVAAGVVSPDILPYDIQQVEVLEGPQGTLYGASSLGGLLKYVTTTPGLDAYDFRVGADISGVADGRELGRGVRASANMPVMPGTLAISISGAAEYSPGFINDVATGAKDYNPGLQDGGRVALLWKPTDALSVKLSALVDKSQFDGSSTAATTLVGTELKPTYGFYDNSTILPQVSRRNFELYSSEIGYDFGWAKLTSLTGYSTGKTEDHVDSSVAFSFLGVLVPVDQSYALNKFTQEFRLSSPDGDRLSWTLGGFYTNEDGHFSLDASALDPVTRLPSPGLNPLYFNQEGSRYQEYAAFGNATFKLTDNWDISGGVRYSQNKQSAAQTTTGALVGGGVIDTGFNPSTEDVTTYSVSTRYRFTSKVMVYGRISTGYQPGGLNQTSPLPNYPKTYNADTLTNYEIGLKSQFLDNRLLLDVTAFHIDWRNLQVAQTNGVFSFTTNSGDATSDGFELTSAYWLTSALKLGFNAAYTDAKLSQDQPGLGAVKGDPLPYTPKFSDTVTLDYSRPVAADYTVHLGGIWRYVGPRDTYFLGSPGSAHLNSYQALDLSAGLSHGKWTANLFARNLTNERAYLYYSGFSGSTILQPRLVGLSLDARF